jgi:phospholipid transport system substrate-binding protein
MQSSQSRKSRALIAILAVSFSCLTVAGQELSAYESVNQSTDELLAKLVEVKPYFESDPDRFFSEIEKALESYVDFEGFSKGVMAKYYRQSTPEQRVQFQATFRTTLMQTYAKALVGFDNQDVLVKQPTAPQKKPDRATIDLEVVAKSGNVYPVQYNLVKKDGRWLLRNVVINGINMGLQFRSQFAGYMQKYKRDISLVIENWATPPDE